MSFRRSFYVGMALCTVVGVVLACGPDFPWQLLDDRSATLKSTPANGFEFEMKHMIPKPADSLQAVEDRYYWPEDRSEKARGKAEESGLDANQVKKLHDMRGADGGDKAYAAGEGLPEAVRLYAAGAVAYLKSDNRQAVQRFQAVLDLPEPDRVSRATWAAYMLGRIHALAGESDAAAKYFGMTRDLALHGDPDPLGLAVASYGEQGGIHFRLASSYIKDKKLLPSKADNYRRELAEAAKYYLDQAAHNSPSGVASLGVLSGQILSEPARIDAAASDPVLQRVLVAFTLTRVPEDGSDDFYFMDEQYPRSDFLNYDPQTGARLPVEAKHSPIMDTLVDAIVKHPASDSLGQDNLAALAYRVGRFDLAAKLAAHSSTPIGAWVEAKIATQKGDLDGAAGYYAEAVKAFKVAPDGLDDSNQSLVVGESGVLSLARGEYLDAMERLYPYASTYWGDVAYLAERVLTVDELKRFVDTQAPVSTYVTAKPDVEQSWRDWENTHVYGASPAAKLRDLLARRLVREGRYTEALGYFHPAEDTHFSDPQVRDHVTAYAKALTEAMGNGDAATRAHGWYDAAVLAKHWGMEMIGYETTPDEFADEGQYEGGYGPYKVGTDYVTPDEKRRYDSSAAQPSQRFHYRYVAVDDIEKATALVPAKSQAYAALLCTAADWMMHTVDQEKRMDDLYRQYVKNGAIVPWAPHFGSDCPPPDFNETVADISVKARQLTAEHLAVLKAMRAHEPRPNFLQRMKGKVHRHPNATALSALLLFVVLGMVGAALWWQKRRKA